MLTFAQLVDNPASIKALGANTFLVGASDLKEVLVRSPSARGRDGTMIFQHETIRMMRAERAEQLDKLRQQIADESVVLPIIQREESMWEYVTVGRASTADIVIDDPAISNVHAHFEIDLSDNSVSVQDVGSSNGTHINRNRLQPHTPALLHSGDCVRFGQSIFYFVQSSTLKELVGGGGR